MSQNLSDSLLIHYEFNGDSLDSSGNNYNPILFRASYATDPLGNDSSAIYFDGVDDLIILPDDLKLKPDFPITIAFWVKMDSLLPEYNVFFTNDFYRFAHSGVWLNLSSQQKMAVNYGNGQSFSSSSRKTKLTQNILYEDTWYYVTGVLWSNYDIRIYINGQEEYGYYDGGASNLAYVGTGGNIGRKDANYQIAPFFFKGYMDDFRYWNRGLTSDEIANLYGILTSIDHKSKNNFNVFPNPAKNFIKIPNNEVGDYETYIYNSIGELKLSNYNSETINIASLENGVYIIKLFELSNGRITCKKFIKH